MDNWIGPAEEVVERLMRETRRDCVDAELLRRDLERMHEDLRPWFMEWWLGGHIDTYRTIEGWSISSLMGKHCGSIPEAFPWLDALLRNPDFWKESLSRPRCGLRRHFFPAKPRREDGN